MSENIIGGIITLTMLALACINAFMGEWVQAIFFAILWLGVSQNLNIGDD